MNSKTLIPTLLGLAAIALVAIACTLAVYALHFGGQSLGNNEIWGQFGDFFGGTLNPIFGLLSLFALLFTIAVQTRQLEISETELRLSREELKASRDELARSADAQRLTAENLQKQASYAALSARIAATSAALQAADQAIARRLSLPGGEAMHALDEGGFFAKSKSLTRELEELMKELRAEDGSSPK